MIRSFANEATRRVFDRERVAKMGHDLQRMAHRKLLLIEAAEDLNDLRIPPGNRLEALKGDRAGQHSIRINDQYRICFRWTPSGAEDVEIVEYH
ncbi:type II toxin-antitoxin system RelE/ParE family toxin [Agromyces sp. NPDC056523]|uniref:type II toxin-antitoxin system RelE/ParE family toxin n=1 Tax=Agromyces sp. NPDC056523 TaxID=3345850 RepID=UPI003670E96A